MGNIPLTAEELRPVVSQIHRRCVVEKPGGALGTISASHIWRIFNREMPGHRPTYGLARAIAATLTELLGRPVTAADLFEFLSSIGKPMSRKPSAMRLVGFRPGDLATIGPAALLETLRTVACLGAAGVDRIIADAPGWMTPEAVLDAISELQLDGYLVATGEPNSPEYGFKIGEGKMHKGGEE